MMIQSALICSPRENAIPQIAPKPIKLMANRQLSNVGSSDSPAVGDQIISFMDASFRWVVRRVIDVIPDTDACYLTDYVAEGFNISGAQMGLSFLSGAGYLLPCFVLAFYLTRCREVASSS